MPLTLILNNDAVLYVPIAHPNKVKATKGSLLIAIVLFLELNYFSKKRQ